MLIAFFRTIFLYILVIAALRIMGKRQIGELQPSELVVTIMISELAAIPMQATGIPLVNGILPIITLIIAEVALSYITLKSEKARDIISGTPSILIENGKINEPEMEKLRFNMGDLLEELRINNCPNIADVEFAILETSGQLSVIQKSQKKPATAEVLNIPTDYEGLPLTLISDGKVNYNNLKSTNLDRQWLVNELAKLGVDDISNVFFASLDTQGNLFYQMKSEPEEE
ncbi:DUF421 domain-containing protein [Petroclostridium sp. X23]|uniref:DUF421 domain-containing protein n=1 Tax=Petroclostridium sp. X23 TaxID=3045146 RepID=UPI0024AE4AC8|nr:DUF421 domain-containing protein [Petroclostridium sp. X23]WHH58913.1 DUF421 domain-containing protein [Petroclostridium sp. X23]